MSFRIIGIDPDPFRHLFDLDDDALRRLGVVRCVAGSDFGYPCRVSLEDASAGDTLLLLPYAHHTAATPYHASGPIFVRAGAQRRVLPAGVVPPYVARRTMSLRGYDDAGMMVDATLCDGHDAGAGLQRLFANAAVEHVHLHNAVRGCFSCVAERA